MRCNITSLVRLTCQARRSEGGTVSIPIVHNQLYCSSRYRWRRRPPRPSWFLRHIHRNSKTNSSIDRLATLVLGALRPILYWSLSGWIMEARSDDEVGSEPSLQSLESYTVLAG